MKGVKYASYNFDPNEHYVLTLDNAKKILAIHQRLRYLPSFVFFGVLCSMNHGSVYANLLIPVIDDPQ